MRRVRWLRLAHMQQLAKFAGAVVAWLVVLSIVRVQLFGGSHPSDYSPVVVDDDTGSSSLPADQLPALPAADVKTYARAVLSAVAHCHAHGVVHLDIKPDNFFLSANGALKLGDFEAVRPRVDAYLESLGSYEKNVFDPSVRRKTDRFLLKFRK